MLLTDSEIIGINQNAEFDSAIGYARKIESAVLEKLKAQEPVGYMDEQGRLWESVDDNILPSDKPLYLHPLPPADVVRVAELETLLSSSTKKQVELTAERDELLAALRLFVVCAYQVSTEIDPRGRHWCEAWLDQALPIAEAAIASVKEKQNAVD